MLDVHAIKSQDLKALSAAELTELAAQMLAHIVEQTKHIGALDKRIGSQAQGIKWRDAKIESITFQLARLKAWRFGAKTEVMNAEQREIFEETFAADHASLEAQLAALQGNTPNATPGAGAAEDKKRRQPKREALPEHLPRVEQRIEPEHTTCPTPECGQPMARVGEDISERLDIIPAQFFVQRQIRGKWACRCCQLLVQEPAGRQVFDNALPKGPRRGPCVALGPASPHRRQPLRGSPPVLPAGADQRPRGRAHAALDAGVLERTDRSAVDAAV
jgi:transposase